MRSFVKKIQESMSWDMEQQLNDYYAEIEVSGFGDMLHDVDRNVKYEAAIKLAIEEVKKRGHKANVLDIGTGTGLLSLIAVRHGADTVVACECFRPMSECARKTIRLNGFDNDRIRVIPKRSTDLKISADGSADLSERCNILVTEIFDTELIGEGAISIFNHAIDNLLTKDCIVVPAKAEVFVQLVESSYLRNYHVLAQSNFAKFKVRVPDDFEKCPGTLPLHDLQLSQLEPHHFDAINVEPMAVFEFDFGKNLKTKDTKKVEFRADRSGTVQNVFVWWQLHMDRHGKHKISCAPDWKSPVASPRWRDHWMQAIYYIPRAFRVERNEIFTLDIGHDEYSFWFQEHGQCTCGLHTIATRAQIACLNDCTLLEKFSKTLAEKLSSCDLKKCLFFADLSLIPFIFIDLELNFNWYFCDKKPIQQIASKLFGSNLSRFSDAPYSADTDDVCADADAIVIDPHFLSNFLPWDNLHVVATIQECLKRKYSLTVIPMRITIHALAVCFSDLFKIVHPVRECNGFAMTIFDDMLKESRISVENVEPHPLWEYPCFCLSPVAELYELKLDTIVDQDFDSKTTVIEIAPTVEKRCANGIAIWIDWHLDDKNNRISTGPTIEPEMGAVIDWCKHVKQGVHFLDTAAIQAAHRDENRVRRIEIKTQFSMKKGRFRFDFSY